MDKEFIKSSIFERKFTDKFILEAVCCYKALYLRGGSLVKGFNIELGYGDSVFF